ncbi:hypothetical protein GbCGDNIH7_7074a [Granulibacter bethesdensis]|nr:hypothetical protein GbCGDNIH4_7031 [Granulibacter bethesdensis CGDNIH4]APH60259.1 hypothetical protein GbCGDNIH7_7074a [Granulibacter bethesdensis]
MADTHQKRPPFRQVWHWQKPVEATPTCAGGCGAREIISRRLPTTRGNMA